VEIGQQNLGVRANWSNLEEKEFFVPLLLLRDLLNLKSFREERVVIASSAI
jgi:hypothetical protein